MSLRGDWQGAKAASEHAFQKEHAAELTKAHTDVPTAYPCKFKKDLGPTLDSYEKAKKAKKDADAKKYGDKATQIVDLYHKDVTGQKKVLGDDASKVLLDELVAIKKALAAK